MAVRIRKSVWSLAQGDPTLSWYRKAVEELLKRPATDPTSWRYLAAVHTTAPGRSAVERQPDVERPAGR